MTNSGLTSRLRQQSRRTGFAVGMVMAVTILLCVGGFVVIYAQVDPLTRDFISAPATTTPTAEPETADSAGNQRDDDQQAADANGQSDNNQQEEPAAPTPTSTPVQESEPTPTTEEFTPTHVSNPQTAVNFRDGPGTNAGIVQVLDAGTPLQATGEEGTGEDGLVWLEFETADGTTGWIREIDSVPQG
jgi:hypothetical protein